MRLKTGLLVVGLLALPAAAQLRFERRSTPSAAQMIWVDSGDFNRDRRLDIAGVTINGTVAVHLNRGDATFDPPIQVPLPVLPARLIAVGELNGDGRPDIVTSNPLAHSVSVALGVGDGTFRAAVQYPCGRSPNGIAIADFTGDGRADIAATNTTGLLPSLAGTTVSILAGRGDGTFGPPIATTTGERPVFAEPADFNGDSRMDLVVINGGGPNRPTAAILISKGDGTFDVSTLGFALPTASRPAVGDWNRDGKTDVALAIGGAWMSFLGNGDGTFRTPPFGGPLDGMGLIAGDFNWDGIPDIASFFQPYAVAIVMLGRGDGSFGEQLPFEIGPTPGSYVLGDFNGDGGLDFLLTHQQDSGLTVLVNVTSRPAISANGVVNAASYLGGPLTVAPGEIVSIFGRDMGPASLVTARLKSPEFLETVLEDTRVMVDGVEAPLVFVRADQISAVMPYRIGVAKPSAQLWVSYRGIPSAAISLRVAPSMPGIFTANASGSGQAAAMNQDRTFNSAANPAVKGSIVTFYATGEGQTDPPGEDGRLAGVPLAQPVLPVIVGVANIGAEVLYAGPVPGIVSGLLQINARIPEDAPSGANVPLVIRVGENFSQPGVTIAIR